MEILEQRKVPGIEQVGFLQSGTSLVGDAPDAAMLVVAAGITEINFAMLNNRVRPVGDVESAVRADLGVDGAEGDVLGAHDVRQFAGDVAGALVVNAEANDAMSAEIASHHRALPVLGEMFALDDFQAAEFRVIARADTAE